MQAFGSTVRRGLRLVVFIGLPAGVGLMLVRTPLTAIVLEGGNFSQADTDRVAFVVLGYATSIWAYSAVQVLTRAFYAQDDRATPVRLAVSMVVLNLTLNLILIWTPLKEAGLAWSTALSATLQAVILWWLLHRRTGILLDGPLVRSLLRTCALTGVMAVVVGVCVFALGDGVNWVGWAWRLGVFVVVGMVSFGGLARVLGMPELSWAMGRSIKTD
jgi:putative peptidoglycan lipid II flippase